MKRQGNDATQSAKGIVYQLCVGILKCYEMRKGQKILIEREGDVSIADDQQLEVKHYSDSLTDSHLNFWNTLNNWMDNKFEERNYSSLILHTTQKIGGNSKLKQWNEASLSERISLLEAIALTSEARFQAALQKNSEAQPSKSLRLQRKILDRGRRAKLESITNKYFIDAASDKMPELYIHICDVYLKGIESQDEFLDSLIGFVSGAKEHAETIWEITFEEFEAKVSELLRIYKKNTFAFPRRNFDQSTVTTGEVISSHLSYRFVEKIIEIDYPEVVPDAINDYLQTVRTLNEDFRRLHISEERTDAYISDLISIFNSRRRIERRRGNPSIKDAQNFYDTFISEEAREFAGMELPPRGFKNGVLHCQIDDPNKCLDWKLENT